MTQRVEADPQRTTRRSAPRRAPWATALVACLGVSAPTEATAQAAHSSRGAKTSIPAARSRALVVVVVPDGLVGAEILGLEQGAARGAGAPWRAVPLPADGLAPDETLRRADLELERGGLALAHLELTVADAALAAAIDGYEREVVALALRDGALAALANAWRRRAIGRFLDGDEEGARAALRRAWTAAAGESPSAAGADPPFPPQMEAFVRASRRAFDALAPGGVSVAEVAGVRVELFLDGRAVGAAPLRRDGLVAGVHLVTVQVAGRAPWTEQVVIESGVEVALALHPPVQDGAAAALVAAAAAGFAAAPKPEAKARLARAAAAWPGRVDGVLLVRRVQGAHASAAAAAAPVLLQAALFDVAAGTVVGRAELPWPDDDDRVARAAELGRAVTAPPLIVAPPVKPAWYQRAYRHRYFWPAVAGLGVVAIGVAVGVGSSGLSPGERIVVLGLSY
jgi:hypothetical protein